MYDVPQQFYISTDLANSSFKKACDVAGDKAVEAAAAGIDKLVNGVCGIADAAGNKMVDVKDRAVGAMASKMESVQATVTPTKSKADDTPVKQSSIDNLPSHVKGECLSIGKSINDGTCVARAQQPVDLTIKIADAGIEAHSTAPMATPAMGYGGRSNGFIMGA